MAGSDWDDEPFKEAEEWRRLRRVLHQFEEVYPLIKAIDSVVEGAKVVKAVTPYALVMAALFILWLNKGALLGGGG